MLSSIFKVSYIIPKVLWHVAGMKRIIKHGKRAFEQSLKENGVPEEIVTELVKEFVFIDEIISVQFLRMIISQEKNEIK
ncbi:hypothetical protein [Thermococcus sp.]